MNDIQKCDKQVSAVNLTVNNFSFGGDFCASVAVIHISEEFVCSTHVHVHEFQTSLELGKKIFQNCCKH